MTGHALVSPHQLRAPLKRERERARQRIPQPQHRNRNRTFLTTLNLGGSGAGLLKIPTDLMNADMTVTTRQQISVQQCMRRLKNKIFVSAYRKGDEMTPEEEEKGHRLQLARVKKKQNAARALSPDS